MTQIAYGSLLRSLLSWAKRHGASYFVGSESNLLNRHREAAEDFDSDPVVRICGDSPFIIPEEIDRVVSEHEENDADYNHPFQEPLNPDIVVDTEEQSIEEGVEHVLRKLKEQGLMDEQLDDEYNFPITRTEEQEVTDRLEDLGYLE